MWPRPVSPQGRTPVHYHRQRRRDKVSVISGISVRLSKRQHLGLLCLSQTSKCLSGRPNDDAHFSLREPLSHFRRSSIRALPSNLALRHQIAVLQRAAIRCPRLTLVDCLLGLAVPHLCCLSGATLHVDFNFSSTYSESSIMRSANCSAGSPAKFLSTNSLT